MSQLRFARACMLSSIAGVVAGCLCLSGSVLADFNNNNAQDPGVRDGGAGAGTPFDDLTTEQRKFFDAGQADFASVEDINDGLGPRFNLDACGGCHAQPATGGTSPRRDVGVKKPNPQVAVATLNGANNRVPSFIDKNGPVREARFVNQLDNKGNPIPNAPDGGVHALFVISGRVDPGPGGGDASGCTAVQEDFEKQVRNKNIIFRIPTPTFGAGLVEMINDDTLADNLDGSPGGKAGMGVSGRLNHSGNDGTVTRFGWKAQNKSLMIFSGEAYNVEMGITNTLFQTERDENPTCQFATVPNSDQDFDTHAVFPDFLQAVENFSNFQRFLDQPKPVASFPGASATSISRGRMVFGAIGCALCHTPTLKTSKIASVDALKKKDANLFSDIAIHNMGVGLADGVSQGQANGDEFRSAPLWGLGQRIFFLHDGRTDDLIQAIKEHASAGSEANTVIGRFFMLSETSKQDLLNFLRSL